jgi:hypothetical protein
MLNLEDRVGIALDHFGLEVRRRRAQLHCI